MVIDGKKIAEEIIADLKGNYTLGVVMDESSAASQSFVKIKERTANRVGVTIKRFSSKDFNTALECDGVIVQLPIENPDELIARIPPEKDVDALGEHPLVLSPVAKAIGEVFSRAGVSVAGKQAVVVGAGRLVGAPAKELLEDAGANVYVVTQTIGSLSELKDADIVVLGAGNPGMVTPEMLKEGVVLIDAGTSEQGGKVAGDADPRCANVASVFTPVPGGIGPIAVAMIFQNLFTLIQRSKTN